MKSDLQISQAKKLRDIITIAKKINLKSSNLTTFGKHIAKINSIPSRKKNGKIILVTAMSPTPAGEGKTTTTVGLTDALRKIGKKSIACLREPSLTICIFGIYYRIFIAFLKCIHSCTT